MAVKKKQANMDGDLPIQDLKEKKGLKKELLHLASNGSELLKSIFDSTVLKYPEAKSSCTLLNGLAKMKSARDRSVKNELKNLKTIGDFILLLKTPFGANLTRIENSDGSNIDIDMTFTVIKERTHSHIIFKNENLLALLRAETISFIHISEIKVLSDCSCQITLFMRKNNKDHPCFVIFLNKYDETSCIAVFSKVQELWTGWSTQKLYTNYDHTLMNALQNVFNKPSVTVSGTYSSFLQLLIQMSWSVGFDVSNLDDEYLHEEEFPILFHLAALPLLPSNYIYAEFEKIKQKGLLCKDNILEKLCQSYENIFLKKIGVDDLSVYQHIEKTCKTLQLFDLHLSNRIKITSPFIIQEYLKTILKMFERSKKLIREEKTITSLNNYYFNNNQLLSEWTKLAKNDTRVHQFFRKALNVLVNVKVFYGITADNLGIKELNFTDKNFETHMLIYSDSDELVSNFFHEIGQEEEADSLEKN